MTLEKCKARKEVMESLNDRSGANHGMSAYARKIRRSVLNRYWQRHISDKNGICYDMLPYVKRRSDRRLHAAVPQATFSFAMTLMDKVGRMERRRMGWVVPKVQLRAASGLGFYARNNCGKCNLGN